MGEIADDMVEGRCCELCGMFFQDPDNPDAIYEHTYPVTCKDCWQDLSKAERRQRQRAMVETF